MGFSGALRVRPTPLIGLGSVVGFLALALAVAQLGGLQTSGNDPASLAAAWNTIWTTAITAGAVALLTTWLGWWRPVLREENRLGGWFRVIPYVFGVAVLFSMLAGVVITPPGATVILLLLVGSLLIAFVEETVFRGLGLVGLRGRLSEPWVWFITTLLFGLSHITNALFGEASVTAVGQAGLTFLLGTVLYLTRRTTGSLLPAMLLHAGFDFGVFVVGTDAPSPLPLLVMFVIFVVFLITFRRAFRPRSATASTPRVG